MEQFGRISDLIEVRSPRRVVYEHEQMYMRDMNIYFSLLLPASAAAAYFDYTPLRADIGFGFMVHGLTPAALASEENQRELRLAFAASRGLMLFPGLWTWSREDMILLSSVFGNIEASPPDGPYETLLNNDTRVHVFHKVPSARVFDGKSPEAEALDTVDGDQFDAARGTPSWHTDQSFRKPPPRATMMYCVSTPADGSGDTLFASTIAAFTALDPAQQAHLAGLHGVHSYQQLHASFRRLVRVHPTVPPSSNEPLSAEASEPSCSSASDSPATLSPPSPSPLPSFLSAEREAALTVPSHHPIAWPHRPTGLTALYLAPHVIAAVTYATAPATAPPAAGSAPATAPPAAGSAIATAPPAAGSADAQVLPPSAEALETALPGLPGRLVDALSSFATSARFRYRHRWTAGDVVVWDNTATMHAATKVPTESEAERTMWRTTIAHDDGPEHPEAAAAMAQRVFRIAAA